MKIEVALYGTLTQYLPTGSKSHKAIMECADGATVAQVIDQLGIPKPRPTMVLINGLHAGEDTSLKEGDLLSLFPPLAGGRDRDLGAQCSMISMMKLQTNTAETFQAAEPFVPAYLKRFESGDLQRQVEEAVASLQRCRVCPWNCEINRLADEKRVCKTGRHARVGSHFPHFGEESCLRGWNGSGTIFFAWCNLRCVFCQNFDLSQQGEGRAVRPEELARMMLTLQAAGCHNINFVTPEHVVPQILEALPIAIQAGLRLPIVYNTSAYDSLESLRLMNGVVDVYMPDFKFWDPEAAKRYVKAKDYPEAARTAIKEMHRQVGPLRFDRHGLAKRGLLVRHLVMPGGIAGTQQIMRFLATELSPDTYVNIMAQYRPAGKVNAESYPEINRMVTPREYEEAVRIAYEQGLYRLDPQDPWKN